VPPPVCVHGGRRFARQDHLEAATRIILLFHNFGASSPESRVLAIRRSAICLKAISQTSHGPARRASIEQRDKQAVAGHEQSGGNHTQQNKRGDEQLAKPQASGTAPAEIPSNLLAAIDGKKCQKPAHRNQASQPEPFVLASQR
jgi:hypothetical protein